jgi:DNA-binding response OmpR family regulator
VPKTRILIAEDDPISRELTCAHLERWGYDAVVARNGSEAMMALRKPDAPTLAILDWMMPGMDGLEICRREREVGRQLYVILLTARSGKENLLEGLAAGADEYLIKPFDKDELRARILVGLRAMAALRICLAPHARVAPRARRAEVPSWSPARGRWRRGR